MGCYPRPRRTVAIPPEERDGRRFIPLLRYSHRAQLPGVELSIGFPSAARSRSRNKEDIGRFVKILVLGPVRENNTYLWTVEPHS